MASSRFARQTRYRFKTLSCSDSGYTKGERETIHELIETTESDDNWLNSNTGTIASSFKSGHVGHSSRLLPMQEFVKQIEYSQRLIQGSHMTCPTDGGPREIVWCVVNGSVATNLAVDHPRIPMLHLPHATVAHSTVLGVWPKKMIKPNFHRAGHRVRTCSVPRHSRNRVSTAPRHCKAHTRRRPPRTTRFLASRSSVGTCNSRTVQKRLTRTAAKHRLATVQLSTEKVHVEKRRRSVGVVQPRARCPFAIFAMRDADMQRFLYRWDI
jgi:hypothetical protein